MKTKAILMDMDGVLFDTERHSVPLIIDIIASQSLTISGDYILSHMGLGPADLLTAYRQHLGPAFDANLYWETYWRERNAFYHLHPPDLKPGALQLLHTCHSANIPCILATSSPHKEALVLLKQAGLDQSFMGVVGGDMFKHGKPHPDIYLAAARLAKQPISQCLVLEDSLNGLKAGKAAGARTVMIPDIVPCSDTHVPYCDYLCDTLLDVERLLSKKKG